MAHVILGLLLITPQSLYDLVKNFEAGVSLMYSASAGSIKRALDRLLSQGLIEIASAEPGIRGRKVYRPTGAGRGEFDAWMAQAPAGGDVESAALPRLFFLGLLEPEERVAVLRRIVARIEGDLSELMELGARLEDLELLEEQREVAGYQLATLEYGLDAHRRALDWFRDRLERELLETADPGSPG